MKTYSVLSEQEKAAVDAMILREVSAGERVNKNNGRRWIEPDETLKRVHDGFACAECLNSYYTCLCSHEE